MQYKALFFGSISLLSSVLLSTLAYAQADQADKTGTNPINFTYDFRVYNEYSWLNTAGDSYSNVTTAEFRMPFLDGKWQFRVRTRYTDKEIDINDDGINEIDDSGLGVTDFRFLTVPIVNMEKKFALAVGFETFLPTGNSKVGSDTLSFGPQVFAVFFVPFGIKNSLIAPAYQHKFSVYEEHGADDVNQSLFDLFFMKQSADKQKWFLINPQYVIDHKADAQLGFIDLEVGTMLDQYLGTKGHSAYIRPSIGYGEDRSTEAGIEFGYKIIW